MNDPTPYGYARAENMGCNVTFSKSAPENAVQKGLRLALRVMFGFDLMHAIHNRQAIMRSEIVWTHTESQFLGVAALLAFAARTDRPRIIGQAIWLLDEWPRLGPFRRAIAKHLLREIDILTVHSPENLAVARSLFPDVRSELVKFGIPTEYWETPVKKPVHPFRILCVGNDRHRDWKTVISAVRDRPELDLTIISQTASAALIAGVDNARIRQVSSNEELLQAYRDANVLVMPLRPNLHSSGITVIQEAALMGVPVISSDVGGLKSYFDETEIRYVPSQDADAVSGAIDWMAANPEESLDQALRAQKRILDGNLGCEAYIRRHAELSAELIGMKESAGDRPPR